MEILVGLLVFLGMALGGLSVLAIADGAPGGFLGLFIALVLLAPAARRQGRDL